MKVIMLSGYAGVGKSTIAKRLRNMLVRNNYREDVTIISFAFAVKEIAKNQFGWDGIKDDKGRRLLQVIGTECGREYDKDIWVDKVVDMLKYSKESEYVIIDDWRFPNECDKLRDVGLDVITFNIVAEWGKQNREHVSETSLDDFYFDGIIHNYSGSLDEACVNILSYVKECVQE